MANLKDRYVGIFVEFGNSLEWAEICHRDRPVEFDGDVSAWDRKVMELAEGWERYSEGGWK